MCRTAEKAPGQDPGPQVRQSEASATDGLFFWGGGVRGGKGSVGLTKKQSVVSGSTSVRAQPTCACLLLVTVSHSSPITRYLCFRYKL